MSFRIAICGIIIGGSVISASNALGQTNAIANGNWSTPGTWSMGEPTATLDAAINNGRTVTIDMAGETTNLLNIGNVSAQTGTLNINGGNLFISDSADTTTAPNSPGIILGANGGTGNLAMTAGDVFVGDNFGSDIFLADAVRPDGEIIIGLEGGTGTMTQSGGIFQTADEAFLGFRPGSTGTLNISAGTFETLGRSIILGFQGGTGNLNVTGTGDVNAAFDILAGFTEGSSSTITLADNGTIDCGFLFTNFAAGGAGSTSTVNMTGGTLTSRIAVVLGQGGGTTTMTHSGGAINVLTNNGDFVVSDSFDPGNANTSTYNISGTATVNLLHNFIVAAFAEATGIVNQTGGTITAGDNVFVGRDNVGTWNISGGSVTATNFDIVLGNFSDASNGTVNQTGGTIDAGVNVVVARDGTGTYNLSAGTVNAQNVFLGDFDTSNGTMKISGGTLNLTGNFSVGGALASNAAPDRVEPDGTNGAQGQALTANGTLIVSGNAATIDIGGDFLANPDDKSDFRSHPFAPGGDNSATLVFEIFSNAGTSLIDVADVADLDGAVIDLDLMSGFTPSLGTTFDLLTASSFGSTGTGTTQDEGTGEGFALAGEDTSAFSLAVVAGGNGEILRATFLGAAVQPGDHNGDGRVDAADYVIWRKNPGAFGGNPAGYNAFRQNFGEPAGGGSGAVPEPAAGLMIVIGSVAVLFRRGQKC